MHFSRDFHLNTCWQATQLENSSENRGASFVYGFDESGATDPSSRGLFIQISAVGFEPWRVVLDGDYEDMGADAIYPCPNPYHLLVVTKASAFLIDSREPGAVFVLDQDDRIFVRGVYPISGKHMILLCGFSEIMAIGETGMMWTSPQLVIDGIRITGITESTVVGYGDTFDDPDLESFEVRLADGHVIRRSQFVSET